MLKKKQIMNFHFYWQIIKAKTLSSPETLPRFCVFKTQVELKLFGGFCWWPLARGTKVISKKTFYFRILVAPLRLAKLTVLVVNFEGVVLLLSTKLFFSKIVSQNWRFLQNTGNKTKKNSLLGRRKNSSMFQVLLDSTKVSF